MPTNLDGVHIFKDAKIMFAPGKAANAGGFAVSGLELSPNSGRRAWSEGELQQMLKDIMDGIHAPCLTYGDQGNSSDEHTSELQSIMRISSSVFCMNKTISTL